MPRNRAWMAIGAVLAVSCVSMADARQHRSTAVLRDFQRACPSTGLHYGACPGYVRDHIVPLCAGGRDAVDNLQWQERAASLAKDRAERALCRALHRR